MDSQGMPEISENARDTELKTENETFKRSFREKLKANLPVLLAHHPLCDKFESHVIKIEKI